MSCLPMMSIRSSISSILRQYDPSGLAIQTESQPKTLESAQNSPVGFDSPYDKLSQVSVSHRRVDSFEWVMTQSAPTTPITSNESSNDPYALPPPRLIGSAPLPVPNESWSDIPRPYEWKKGGGYFDQWFSPSLSNSRGYNRVSEDNNGEESLQASKNVGQKSFAGPSRACPDQSRISLAEDMCAMRKSSSIDNTRIQVSGDLGALGISFDSAFTSSPPTSVHTKPDQFFVSSHLTSRASAPRLPKRVSFSPMIDEVILEPLSNPACTEQQPLLWGSYLPSSFLVARPILSRPTSLPMHKGKTTIRPILRHSTPLNHQSPPDRRLSTEMIHLDSRLSDETSICNISVPSPIPTQRLSTVALSAGRHRQIGESSEEIDRAFVSFLQPSQKPARRRSDSLFSITSNDSSDGRKSF